MTVVIDGNEGEYHDSIGETSIAFSPDSKRVAYVALLYSKKLLGLFTQQFGFRMNNSKTYDEKDIAKELLEYSTWR